MQSHFVKLDPPYQSIHYGGVVGIQIGTLITVANEYPGDQSLSNVYTHSHPVVSYVDKNLFKRRMGNHRANPTLAAYWGGGEGNVWSKVEINDVDVLGLWDTDQFQDSYPFEWDDFVMLVECGFSLTDVLQGKSRERGIYDLKNYLEKVGFSIVLPDLVEHFEMTFSIMSNKDKYGLAQPSLLCKTEDGLISFYVPFYDTNAKHVAPIVTNFIQQYLTIMQNRKATLTFYNETCVYGEQIDDDDPRIKDIDELVKYLNETFNKKNRELPF